MLVLGGVAVFSVPAWLGVRRAAVWLPAGWALHVVWDVALHAVAPLAAPAWYVWLCLGFDLVVAGAVLHAGHAVTRPRTTPRATRTSGARTAAGTP